MPVYLNERFDTIEKHIANTPTKEEAYLVEPDKIDCGAYWRELVDKYGVYAICGAIQEFYPSSDVKAVEQANIQNRAFIDRLGLFSRIFPLIQENLAANGKCKILEIGPGFGSFYNMLLAFEKEKIDYYSVDVVKLFEHPKAFLVTDNHNIPEEIGCDFDIVYSSNVFQHLSLNQRAQYTKQASKLSKPYGSFVFTEHFFTENPALGRENMSITETDGVIKMGPQLTPIVYLSQIPTRFNRFGFRTSWLGIIPGLNMAAFHCVNYSKENTNESTAIPQEVENSKE